VLKSARDRVIAAPAIREATDPLTSHHPLQPPSTTLIKQHTLRNEIKATTAAATPLSCGASDCSDSTSTHPTSTHPASSCSGRSSPASNAPASVSVADLTPHLRCGLCRDLAAGALVLSCGHLFCGQCLAEQCMLGGSACPACQMALRAIPVRCVAIDRVVSALMAALVPSQQEAFKRRRERGEGAPSTLAKMLWWLESTPGNGGCGGVAVGGGMTNAANAGSMQMGMDNNSSTAGALLQQQQHQQLLLNNNQQQQQQLQQQQVQLAALERAHSNATVMMAAAASASAPLSAYAAALPMQLHAMSLGGGGAAMIMGAAPAGVANSSHMLSSPHAAAALNSMHMGMAQQGSMHGGSTRGGGAAVSAGMVLNAGLLVDASQYQQQQLGMHDGLAYYGTALQPVGGGMQLGALHIQPGLYTGGGYPNGLFQSR